MLCIYVFSPYLFNKISSKFGGAKPFVMDLIGPPDTIKYLSNFNIESEPNGNNPSVQTRPLCNIYQNREFIILGITTTVDNLEGYRVVILEKEQIYGFGLREVDRERTEKAHCQYFMKWNKNSN